MEIQNKAQATGLGYEKIAQLAEEIAQKTHLRDVNDYALIINGMGGIIHEQDPETWEKLQAKSIEIEGPGRFNVYVAAGGGALNKIALACAIGHYVLHGLEGKVSCSVDRFSSGAAGTEALWFGLSLLIPDNVFKISSKSKELSDSVLAQFFNVPVPLIGLKRKVLSSQTNAFQIEVSPTH